MVACKIPSPLLCYILYPFFKAQNVHVSNSCGIANLLKPVLYNLPPFLLLRLFQSHVAWPILFKILIFSTYIPTPFLLLILCQNPVDLALNETKVIPP